MSRLNYDDIAHLYDEPGRDHAADSNLLAFLQERGTGNSSVLRVLDVGCGTGKQLAANRHQLPDARLIGVDRFRAMLRIARRRCPAAAWIQADGATLPFASSRFDYATSQFSYPHVRNTGQLLGEIFRVLKSTGRFVMTNIDPWSMAGWLVYRYFPEARALDQQDFLPVERFVALMRDVGFQDVDARYTDLSRDEALHEFLAYASTRHRASQLMAISDAAYEAGLDQLKQVLAQAGTRTVVEPSAFVLVTIVGDKSRAPKAV